MGRPSIDRIDNGGPTRAAVLVLHGGTQRSASPVHRGNLSWRRAAALQRALAARIGSEGIDVWLLRYGQRGWNNLDDPAPVPDARWALTQMKQYADVPIALVGHSMGARTGARIADDSLVRGLVALAPWFPPGEPVSGLKEKDLVVAHGRRDRITSYAASQEFVRRCEQVARTTEFVDRGPVGHYLLRDVTAWNDLAASRALQMLELD
ncbi:alpha/beta hydrolase [Nocardioides humilatus]|uniref:alpha/beta hydrolase n=1 Tax=Nocardioides humilatus TaxID=2607660 RepID=UPI00165FEE21|nr:alpha/beta fold hydrolase [Nocardioides humilatus]